MSEDDKKTLPVDLTKLGKTVSKRISRDRKKMSKMPKKYGHGEGVDESCKYDKRSSG